MFPTTDNVKDINPPRSLQAVRDLPVGELQRRLAADGVMIHYDFD